MARMQRAQRTRGKIAERSSVLPFGEVVSIRYLHIDDGGYYEHEFGQDVMMTALPDGALRIEKAGSTVWSDL